MLDSALSKSYIMKQLAQHIQLPCIYYSLCIGGFGGVNPIGLSRDSSFSINNLSHDDNVVSMEVVVLSEVTAESLLHHVPADHRSKHMSGLRLADPKFNIPGSVELLLHADMFGSVMRHGCWIGMGSQECHLHFKQPLLDAGGDYQCRVANLKASDDLIYVHASWKTLQNNFQAMHTKDKFGKYVVPLPKRVSMTF